MATSPQHQQRPQQHLPIHARAQTGFAKSAAYDAHRPAYSPTIVQFLLEQLRVADKKHARIVDLAAGTGKFTEALAGREEELEILAIEPHAGMRDVLAGKALRGVSVLDGTADAMPVEDESVDAVVVAQAFHWFPNTLSSLHRVLRPHGVLGLVWNIEDYNAPTSHAARTPWLQKLQDLNYAIEKEVDDHEPRFRHMQWRKVFDEQIRMTPLSLLTSSAGDQLFSLPLGEHVEEFEHVMSVEALWARFETLGHIAPLEGEAKDRVYQRFMDAVRGSDVEKNEKGEVTVYGATYTYWTSKIPTDGRETVTGVERSGV